MLYMINMRVYSICYAVWDLSVSRYYSVYDQCFSRIWCWTSLTPVHNILNTFHRIMLSYCTYINIIVRILFTFLLICWKTIINQTHCCTLFSTLFWQKLEWYPNMNHLYIYTVILLICQLWIAFICVHKTQALKISHGHSYCFNCFNFYKVTREHRILISISNKIKLWRSVMLVVGDTIGNPFVSTSSCNV